MKVNIKEVKTLVLLALSWIGVQGQNIDTITAYPNPFYDTLNISFELNSSDTLSLKVFIVNGATIAVLFEDSVLTIGKHDLTVNFDTLNPALYFLVLRNNEGESAVKKIIKSRYPLSIDKLPNQQISTFYPNPSSGILFTINPSIERMTIYDLKGRKIKELLNIGQTIDCTDLPYGTYIFRVQLTTGEERFQLIEMTN